MKAIGIKDPAAAYKAFSSSGGSRLKPYVFSSQDFVATMSKAEKKAVYNYFSSGNYTLIKDSENIGVVTSMYIRNNCYYITAGNGGVGGVPV